MEKAKLLVILPALLILFPMVHAHGAETQANVFLNFSKLQLATYGGIAVVLLSVFAVAMRRHLNKQTKKYMFAIILAVIVVTTAVLDFSVVYGNIVSPTHGPVHWHASVDFEICGIKYQLSSMNIGEDKPLHTHGDGLIHIETTPLSWEDVEIHHFFENIGGEFTDTSISFPIDVDILSSFPRNSISVKNGDLCNGKPGTLTMLVNGKPEPKMSSYIISPVEAGDIDKITIVFGE